MKKNLFYSLFILLSFELNAQQVSTCNTYTFENGVKRDANSRPYTGACVTNYSNGKINIRGSFKEGLQHGKWEYFLEDGKIETIESYKSGMKDGTFERYYVDEKGAHLLIDRKKYKDDKADGIWELYSNGILYDLRTYKNGEKNGEFREYNMENGELQEIGNVKTINGKSVKDGIQIEFKKAGKNDTTTYKDGVLDGLQVRYSKTGQLQEKIIWSNGLQVDGIYERFYEDGTIMSRIEYKGGVINGVYEQYWNGKFIMKGTVINGKKEGRWEEYGDDGKLSKKKSGYYEGDKKVRNLD